MADEELTGIEPGQDDGAQVVETEEKQPPSVEDLAREMGWRPESEFKGDPSEFRSAEQFIREGREVQRSLTRELRGVREEVSRMGQVSSRIMADELAKRDEHWQARLARAVEDGKLEDAKTASAELAKIDTERKQTGATPAPPAETSDFMERNKVWFDVDPLATLRAKEIADSLAKNGVSIPEQLRQVERAIRKEFPEHFPAPAKTPPGTQTGASRSAATGSRTKGYADMPEASRKMADEYEKTHGVPKENFAKSYWADQERRVA